MFDYKLRFQNKEEAERVVSKAIGTLHPSQYVLYTIGQPKEYIYDEEDLEAPPRVVILDQGWHVDLRLREEEPSLLAYTSNTETEYHTFS